MKTSIRSEMHQQILKRDCGTSALEISKKAVLQFIKMCVEENIASLSYRKKLRHDINNSGKRKDSINNTNDDNN